MPEWIEHDFNMNFLDIGQPRELALHVGLEHIAHGARVPYRQHKGRKLVLGDRTEALVYILAHELRHMHQQHGYAVHSVFSVGRVKNSRGRFSEVDTEAFAIHKLRAWRRGTFRPFGQSAT